MSHVVDHVDEAQLHAYLDRDLEFADPEVRKAMGLHIADCSKCSALLKEVRQVYKAANQLLDVATPPARSAPSFEDIVKRAADRQDDVGADTLRSRFLRGQDQSDPDTTGDFEIDLDDLIEDPVEAEDHVVFIEASAEDAGETEEVVDESLIAGADQDVVDIEPSPVLDEQPEIQELAIPSEDEIVFIEAEPVAEKELTPVIEVAGPPAPQVETVPPKRRSTRILALAATITVAVGIGGWFGRPYIMTQFFDAPATVAASESVSENRTAAQAPSGPALRQEEGTVAAGAPSDTRLLAADAMPGRADAPSEQDLADSAGGFADGEFQERSNDLAEPEATALSSAAEAVSPLGGRTIVGNVRDAASKRAITGAAVAITGTNQVARTDSLGRYEITNVPAGSVNVDVLGVGYERVAKGLAISESEGAIADFELRRSVVAMDEIVTAGAGQAARAREQTASAPRPATEPVWSVTPRVVAEALLGGPLVAIDGSRIERIERAIDRAEIRVTQATRTGELIHIRITSAGAMGDDATLESVEITSPEGQQPSTGIARYGSYAINIAAPVSGAELESLLRRLTVAPEVN